MPLQDLVKHDPVGEPSQPDTEEDRRRRYAARSLLSWLRGAVSSMHEYLHRVPTLLEHTQSGSGEWSGSSDLMCIAVTNG